MKTFFELKDSHLLIIFAVIISFILFLLLLGTIKLEENIEKKMIQISTADVKSIVLNSAKSIKETLDKDKNYVEQILENRNFHNKIETNLETLVTQNIKYAYLLYKDNRGVFRFLVDGAKGLNKAFPNQKFDIDNKKWLMLFDTKAPIIIQNKYLKQISITYLVPIIQNNEVILILAIDFSIKKVKEINDIISIIKDTIIIVIFILLLFLFVLLIQSKRYISVKQSAYTDKLTNVFNRNYLQEYEEFINLDDYIIAAIDIDNFKLVNDNYGHNIGDKILKQVAVIILKSTRKKDDIVIRYGGEEFLIFAKVKRNDNLIALNVIERIFTNIQKEKFPISNKSNLDITVSIGVNLQPAKSKNFEEAFKLADKALYLAKDKGRNNIQIYNENSQVHDDNKLSINEIKEALDEKRVFCFYQKVVDTYTKEEIFSEALLRIRKKDNSIAEPIDIISSIKGTFILRNISKRVLKICFERLRKNKTMFLNVNLNSQDIKNDSIIKLLEKNAFLDKDISNRLGLEIILNEKIVKDNKVKENLLKLKELGYKIYIDNFGVGYSNLHYLCSIKVDYIKIDGDIIKSILEDKIAYLFVKNIINFAKEADIKVIAKHVFSNELYEKLKILNVDYCQGFLFDKPKSFDD
ncbi:diguanylate cyclase/phosphodiesterase [Malaciobacter marinus]|uniref:Diguanylate cyclase/phosphodiesterase n=3 Tax=Malaciobacter marinus TaxID=505249 RepID=A0A347TLK9_9BACT|nr:EAL domain-containing protein [Malaciobacter marinus]AXX87487.1 diguanylate cyclase/phosphodiesterase [Malaciobacter marinus]